MPSSRVGIVTKANLEVEQIINVSKLIGYFTQFLYSKNTETRHDGKKLICIVGREYCYESTKELPIAKLDEAIKAAQLLDDIAPFSGRRYFLVDKTQSDRSRITFFVINQKFLEQIERRAWMIIPESLLTKQWLDSHKKEGGSFLTAKQQGRSLLAYRTESEFRSQLATDEDTENDFFSKQFSGIAKNNIELSEDKTEAMLLESIAGLPTFVLKQSFNSARLKRLFSGVPWLNGALLFSGMFALYLAMSSLYLYVKSERVASQLAEQRTQLNEVFALQSKYDNLASQLVGLENNAELDSITSSVWSVIFELLNHKDLDILSFQYEAGMFSLRTKSIKATDVIERVSKMSTITDVELTSPVVKSGNRELLSFKFRLVSNEAQEQQISPEEESNAAE